MAPVHVRPVKQGQVPYGVQGQGAPGQADVQPDQPGQPGYAPQGQPGQVQSGQTGQPQGQVPPAQPGQDPQGYPQQSFESPADPTNRQHP